MDCRGLKRVVDPRPLHPFGAPSDGNDVYRKKGCARRWQKNLFISMSLGRKFSSSEHPAAFRGERMFQLVFGWVREVSERTRASGANCVRERGGHIQIFDLN